MPGILVKMGQQAHKSPIGSGGGGGGGGSGDGGGDGSWGWCGGDLSKHCDTVFSFRFVSCNPRSIILLYSVLVNRYVYTLNRSYAEAYQREKEFRCLKIWPRPKMFYLLKVYQNYTFLLNVKFILQYFFLVSYFINLHQYISNPFPIICHWNNCIIIIWYNITRFQLALIQVV